MRRIVLLLSVVLIAVAAVLFFQQSSEKNEIANREMFDIVMSEKMAELYDQAQDWSQPMQFKLQDKRLKGDYKILSEFVLNYWVENIETRNAYLRELKAVKWDQFLDVNRLDRDSKQAYKETEHMLMTAHQVTQQYQQQNEKNKQEAIAKIKQLDVNPEMRESMQAKLEQNLSTDKESSLILVELKILDKADALFEMLKKYKWEKLDGKILFQQEAQVQQFNTLYQDVLKLNAQIEQKKEKNAEALEGEI